MKRKGTVSLFFSLSLSVFLSLSLSIYLYLTLSHSCLIRVEIHSAPKIFVLQNISTEVQFFRCYSLILKLSLCRTNHVDYVKKTFHNPSYKYIKNGILIELDTCITNFLLTYLTAVPCRTRRWILWSFILPCW